jgi:arginase family enzyme
MLSSGHNAPMTAGIHLNLDNAWDASRFAMRTGDALAWGPRLRYTASEKELAQGLEHLSWLARDERFILYGSGDFHHLAGWFLRRAIQRTAAKNVILVSFDNHPDWDLRPPRWGCGGWINRALETNGVARASVWGCGNFELAFPSRLFRNTRALDLGRLEVHAWKERQSAAVARLFNCMTSENWRDRFLAFARTLVGANVYITIDMDTLHSNDALTNWEHGLFSMGDLTWALDTLRHHARIIGGDLCGAYSPPLYARPWQRFIGNFDHPKLPPRNLAESQAINHPSLDALWPALVGS